MNQVQANQICNSAIAALSHGETSLATFPKLLRRIIEERAWEARKVPGKGIVTMQSLRELVTTAPITGWGEDPSKIEAIIRDDAEVLALWREAMKGRAGRPKADDKTRRNPTALKRADRGRAYDLSRLQREAPELFAKVAAGEMSANAAALKAGFRKVKTPLENLRAAWAKATNVEQAKFLQKSLPEDLEGAAAIARVVERNCLYWSSTDDGEIDRDDYIVYTVILASILIDLENAGVALLLPDNKTAGRGAQKLTDLFQNACDEVEMGDPAQVAKMICLKKGDKYAGHLKAALLKGAAQ